MIFFCIFLSLFLCIQNVKAQFINYSITTGRSFAIIPFEMHNDFIVIPVNLQGKLPLQFILDTGAPHTLLIYKEFSDMLNIPYQRRLFIKGADRSQLIKVLLTEKINLELPEIIAKDQNILVLEENYVALDKYAGTQIDGILGIDIFKRFIVKIDYIAKKIFLFEPKKNQLNTSKYSSIKIEEHPDKMIFRSTTSIENGKNLNVDWVIDSGAAMTVLLQKNESDTILVPSKSVPGNIGKGLGGYILGYLGKINQVNFGHYSYHNILGNFQQLPDSLYLPKSDTIVEGLLGNKILQQFHLLFNFQEKIIYAKPNRFYSQSVENDLSGMSLFASGPYLKTYEVEEVFPNSPAAQAGIQKGDVLKKINNRTTSLFTLEQIENKLKKNKGKKIKLVFKREEKKIKLELFLKEYI